MANLFATMRAAATGLDALQKAASASQNNVANASTPGYAKQRALVSALPYDAGGQLSGGVEVRGLMSSRDEFAEEAVRHQGSALGAAGEKATQMAFLEGNFALDDATGISVRMDELFTAFNSWSVAPNSVSEKTTVIGAAQNVAEAFRRTAEALQESGRNAEVRIRSTFDQIDDIAERIRSYNIELRSNGNSESGSEATVHADLEELAQYVEFQTLWQKDGTVTVLIGREAALVTGDQRFQFSVVPDPAAPLPGLEGATPKLRIMDHTGSDVTRSMASGQLGALLDFRNTTIPGLAGNVTQPGDLNRMASEFANRVNQIVTGGDPTVEKLFTYGTVGSAAQSIQVPAGMVPSKLSAANTVPPSANGRALELAGLAHPGKAADEIDGLSYISFFGKISAGIGRLSREADQALTSHQQLHAQALSVREEISGISLDEEAVALIGIQRAYEATSRMIAVIDEMTKIAVNLGRN